MQDGVAGAALLGLDGDLDAPAPKRFSTVARTASAWWPRTQMTRELPSARAIATGYSIIGRPATACSTLALSDFMRVPRPAARMTVASDMSRKYRCAASADQVPSWYR